MGSRIGATGLRVGGVYEKRGDVTTLASVVDRSPTELERVLGFGVGRLKDGYSLLFLVGKVGPMDFVWGDQTRYSGRWQFRRDIGEYVQRADLLRASFAERVGGDEQRTDAAFYEFMGNQQNRLNARAGMERIVKIIPVVPHDAGKGWEEQYPNAPIGGIPQWTLTHAKKMLCVANVLPGAMYRSPG